MAGTPPFTPMTGSGRGKPGSAQRAAREPTRWNAVCAAPTAPTAGGWSEASRCTAENGEILKWFGTCTDIEDIKQAEKALREANDLLEQRVSERTEALEKTHRQVQSIIDNSAAIVYALDLEGALSARQY